MTPDVHYAEAYNIPYFFGISLKYVPGMRSAPVMGFCLDHSIGEPANRPQGFFLFESCGGIATCCVRKERLHHHHQRVLPAASGSNRPIDEVSNVYPASTALV